MARRLAAGPCFAGTRRADQPGVRRSWLDEVRPSVVYGMDSNWLEKACTRLGDAVIDPATWPAIMDEISAAVGATGAGLLQSDVRTPDIPRSAGVDEGFRAYFAEGWHASDIRAERGVPLAMAGERIIIDQDIVTAEEIKRLPFYTELLAPRGLGWFAAVTFRAGPAPWVMSIQRSHKEGPFEAYDKPTLVRLSRRLTEVASLSTAVGRMVLSGATDALNAVHQAAVAIDRFGFVLETNPAAEALFDDHLRIKDRRLVAFDAEARSALEKLYDRLRVTSDLVPLPCDPLVVRRRDKAPVILRILPVPPSARVPFLGARALVTLTAMERRPGPHAALLAGAFGLTPAESRLASIIAAGGNPERAAEELKIAKATARNHLKAIFAKTATRRQSELVALLSRF
jgi:DNA-binding CsgD family transcriptional regulator